MMVKLPDPHECRSCKLAERPQNVRVVESRQSKGYIRRRRKCMNCKRVWRTWETIVNPHDFPKEILLNPD